jgi:hypothetical protein
MKYIVKRVYRFEKLIFNFLNNKVIEVKINIHLTRLYKHVT